MCENADGPTVVEVNENLDRLAKRTTLDVQSDDILRNLLQVFDLTLIDVEMHTITSKMAHKNDPQIVPSRSDI
jgi:hypothetical protein